MTTHGLIWDRKKKALRAELDEFARRSPILSVKWFEDCGDEVRALLGFDTQTLVKSPGGHVQTCGPVLVGCRYHARFLGEAPVPYELISILEPRFVFLPNASPAGALCLGHPGPGISLMEILHLTWAALTVNLRVTDLVTWHALNVEAAAFVRANQERFPLTERGLLEAPAPRRPWPAEVRA
jgi:hypothetical protein